jgi:hypothetical protein
MSERAPQLTTSNNPMGYISTHVQYVTFNAEQNQSRWRLIAVEANPAQYCELDGPSIDSQSVYLGMIGTC